MMTGIKAPHKDMVGLFCCCIESIIKCNNTILFEGRQETNSTIV